MIRTSTAEQQRCFSVATLFAARRTNQVHKEVYLAMSMIGEASLPPATSAAVARAIIIFIVDVTAKLNCDGNVAV